MKAEGKDYKKLFSKKGYLTMDKSAGTHEEGTIHDNHFIITTGLAHTIDEWAIIYGQVIKGYKFLDEINENHE